MEKGSAGVLAEVAMRYSKRDRDAAALICAISASSEHGEIYAQTCPAIGVDVCGPAHRLAFCAYVLLVCRLGMRWTRETDAEAEALIRTGWEPD